MFGWVIKMDVFERIENLCHEKNCKISDVAKNSGLSLHVIYDWKKKKTEPTLAALQKVCNYFCISLYDFFNFGDLTEEQVSFIQKYNQLTDSQRLHINYAIEIAIKNNKEI